MGWQIARQIAQVHDVTVLTGDLIHPAGNGELERLLDKIAACGSSVAEKLQVCYVSPSWIIWLLERCHRLPGCWWVYYLAYNLWQRKAFHRALEIHRRQPFDVCHQVTYIGYREPGFLWKLGIPFFWGPISGCENIPASFYSVVGVGGLFRTISRDIANKISIRIAIRSKTAARYAAKVWAVSQAESDVLKGWACDSELMLETGAGDVAQCDPKLRGAEEPLRIIWCGLCIARKGFPLLLAALREVEQRNPRSWTLEVIGDGPMLGTWKRQAEEYGLLRAVRWLGQLTHQQVKEAMASGHILVHTGLREGTPHVILEALALGLPVACHDSGGMGTAVDESCGRKIPLINPQESERNFARFIFDVIEQPGLLGRLSQGALARARSLSWKSIGDRMLAAYDVEAVRYDDRRISKASS